MPLVEQGAIWMSAPGRRCAAKMSLVITCVFDDEAVEAGMYRARAAFSRRIASASSSSKPAPVSDETIHGIAEKGGI